MVTDVQVIWRLILAAILSGLVGFEREVHGRAAGFRTHILVCVGSALIMLVSMHVFSLYEGIAAADPARIAAGVVMGIGFIGAGTIMRFRSSVRGLTTAASLWTVAGIGLAVGSGFYNGAMMATVIVLIALVFFSRLERTVMRRGLYRVLVAQTDGGSESLVSIRKVLRDYGAEIRDLEVARLEVGEGVRLEMDVRLITDKHDDQIMAGIMRIEGVRRAGWR